MNEDKTPTEDVTDRNPFARAHAESAFTFYLVSDILLTLIQENVISAESARRLIENSRKRCAAYADTIEHEESRSDFMKVADDLKDSFLNHTLIKGTTE